jgi:hypothetical protein
LSSVRAPRAVPPLHYFAGIEHLDLLTEAGLLNPVRRRKTPKI